MTFDLKVERFEKDLFSLDTTQTGVAIENLVDKYDDFFYFYFRDYYTWNFRDTSGSWEDSVVSYVSDTVLRAVYDSVQIRFADFSPVEDDLNLSLRYFNFYLPQAIASGDLVAVTVLNAPGRSAFTYGDSILCIALDDYMGPGFFFYHYQDIPGYLLRRFRPEYIVPNSIQVLATREFPFNAAGKKLLDAMIYNGKIMYLKSRVMPEKADSLITGFRGQDLEWCRENEAQIWKFFVTKDLLYEQDQLDYMKYVTEGPTTSGMPGEAPGNVGSWVGWRIVNAYMKKNKDVSLFQLMEDDDSQKILSMSQYKP